MLTETPTARALGPYEVEVVTRGDLTRLRCSGRDSRDGHSVVIKSWPLQSADFGARFLAVAARVAELEHPNLVKVLDFGVDGETPYLVEEPATGQTLRQRMDHEPALSLREKLDLLHGVSQGLAYAHSRALCHHELKPTNIWIGDDGRPRIADVGLAGLEAGDETGGTRLSNVLERYGHLSPEQLRGEAADERADLFAFGTIAYELIASNVPFPCHNMMELIREVLEKEPTPLATAVPECPPNLERLVTRCLAKSPEERFAKFDEVSRELEAIRKKLGRRGTGKAKRALAATASAAADRVRKIGRTAVMTREEVAAALEPEPSGRPPQADSETSAATTIMTAEEVEAALAATSDAAPPVEADEERFDQIAGGGSTRWTLRAAAGWPRQAAAATRSGITILAKRLDGVVGLASRRRPAVLAAVAVLLLTAAGVALIRSQTGDVAVSRPVAPAPPRPETVAPVEATSVAAVVLGHVEIDALPWGEVVRVLDEESSEVTLPATPTTPLRIDLPAGRYRIFLSHPSAPEPQSCEVEVASGQSSRCQVAFSPVDAVEYLTRELSGS